MQNDTRLHAAVFISIVSVIFVAIPLIVCLTAIIYTVMYLFGAPMRIYTAITSKEKHHGK